MEETKNSKSNWAVDERGYYGEFGGAFIPEMLYPNVKELQEKYLAIMSDEGFKKEFDLLLKDYVGRPTPCLFLLFYDFFKLLYKHFNLSNILNTRLNFKPAIYIYGI